MHPVDLLDGRLKVRHLVLVAAIAEHGTLTRAAERLYITQPVLTRGLREVEGILGVELFERQPRGVTPTVFGAAFLGHARSVLAELRRASEHVADLAEANSGTVTVGNHLAGSTLLLPRALERLKAERPRVVVSVRETTPDVLLAELLAGKVDLIVGRLASEPGESRFCQRALYREPITLVTRVGHPARGLSHPTLAELVRYPWIIPVEQTTLRRELEELFLRQGLSLPADRIECTSMLTLRTLLLDTDLVAALPLLVAHSDEQLACLNTSLEPVSRTVGVTFAAERTLTPTGQALLHHLEMVGEELQETLSAA